MTKAAIIRCGKNEHRCPLTGCFNSLRDTAEAIHFCTCAFAKKGEGGWVAAYGGFRDHPDEIIQRIHDAAGLPVVKGTAHLQADYSLQVWGDGPEAVNSA